MPFGMLTRRVFGMWTQVGSRNHVLDGGPDHHNVKGQFWGWKGPAQDMPGDVRRSIYSKWPSRRPAPRYGADSDCGVLDRVHIGATWRIRLNRSCAAAMRPYVKLLWPLVIIVTFWAVCSKLTTSRNEAYVDLNATNIHVITDDYFYYRKYKRNAKCRIANWLPTLYLRNHAVWSWTVDQNGNAKSVNVTSIWNVYYLQSANFLGALHFGDATVLLAYLLACLLTYLR